MDLIIMGEAAKQLPVEIRKRAPAIPWSKIIGMRNILTHNYPEADEEIIWKTIKNRLPELKPAIIDLLDEQREKE